MAQYSNYQTVPRPQNVDKPADRAVHTMTPVLVLGFGLAAVLAVLLLLMQAKLTILSVETAQLEKEHMQLEQQRDRLEIDYAVAFRPQRLDDYASDELGMVKPKKEQYIEMNNGNQAEHKTR